MGLEQKMVITKKNLDDNGYTYKGMFADTHIYGKENHRMLMEPTNKLMDEFKIFTTYMFKDNKGYTPYDKIRFESRLPYGLQLDLFENRKV